MTGEGCGFSNDHDRMFRLVLNASMCLLITQLLPSGLTSKPCIAEDPVYTVTVRSYTACGLRYYFMDPRGKDTRHIQLFRILSSDRKLFDT